ncbi:hypothetical protein Nmel_017708, partial [Mimus melanotis]
MDEERNPPFFPLRTQTRSTSGSAFRTAPPPPRSRTIGRTDGRTDGQRRPRRAAARAGRAGGGAGSALGAPALGSLGILCFPCPSPPARPRGRCARRTPGGAGEATTPPGSGSVTRGSETPPSP